MKQPRDPRRMRVWVLLRDLPRHAGDGPKWQRRWGTDRGGLEHVAGARFGAGGPGLFRAVGRGLFGCPLGLALGLKL
eukprot:CAMPEP_0174386764 /NCGR_PEP_ID=MMETSP0811_2-20130205/127499_1 /TAXON_ID=73025 ORGANISM="Eutreptiella gymnastica-like, Strain CCMP1594" /NCGR_SAMPLE_ID=MMETSP0811_2 /ASSEMBLY_ACC=CAM_ASM_000667 /LENGTH=76 /DNA_ID=CAMNT_0015541553 /DNA_START=115 /DNA_END=345 /DNA_ORIENTATION=-